MIGGFIKKLIALFVSTLLFATSLTSLAAGAPASAQDTATQEALTKAEQYAYLDLDSASPSMQQKILDARNTIIFSKDWVADGYEADVEDVTTGEVLETLPSFSELFPGWDLPVDESIASTSNDSSLTLSSSEVTPFSNSDWLRLGSTRHYLPAASNSHDASGTIIRSYATSLTSSKNCNIGYTNASTGKSLGYKNNLSVNQALAVHNVGGMRLAIRASTYSTPGYATMAVDGANRIINVR